MGLRNPNLAKYLSAGHDCDHRLQYYRNYLYLKYDGGYFAMTKDYNSARKEIPIKRQSVSDLALLTLTTVAAFNGAAAIALLSFIGSIWTNPATSAVSLALAKSTIFFKGGLLCAVIGVALTFAVKSFEYLTINDKIKLIIFRLLIMIASAFAIVAFLTFWNGVNTLSQALIDYLPRAQSRC